MKATERLAPKLWRWNDAHLAKFFGDPVSNPAIAPSRQVATGKGYGSTGGALAQHTNRLEQVEHLQALVSGTGNHPSDVRDFACGGLFDDEQDRYPDSTLQAPQQVHQQHGPS